MEGTPADGQGCPMMEFCEEFPANTSNVGSSLISGRIYERSNDYQVK
jgi:hypothetical protein